MPRIAQRFEELLDAYRRPDGQRWRGADIVEATGGVVTRSYISALRKGNIDSPGYDKLHAIARAVGFPVELWFAPNSEQSAPVERDVPDDVGFADRLERLFQMVTDGKKGRSYTNAEVARMSLGGISEEQIAAIRTGEATNPTLDEVLALAEAFGVSPSYFTERQAPLLDTETMKMLGDQKSVQIAAKSLDLSDGEKDLVMDMIDRLALLHDSDGGA